MKIGTLVKVKNVKSEKGYDLGIVMDIYMKSVDISMAEVFLFEENKTILAWAKDLETISEP